MSAPLSHAEALDCICGAAGVTVLSYEEAIDAYVRLRCLDTASPNPPQEERSDPLDLAAGDDDREALVETIKAIAERWIYRTAHHGPEHLCSGIAQEVSALAAFQSRKEESR